MSELGLTFARLAFLAMLWAFVLFTVLALRRDLRQPAQARPVGKAYHPPRPPKPTRSARPTKVKGTKLVVVEGSLSGTVIPLGSEQVTIGRAPDSTLVIEDDYASSRHARVYPSEGTWVIEDLGSTNGTWIDRTRITSPTVLPIGTGVRIGRTTLELRK